MSSQPARPDVCSTESEGRLWDGKIRCASEMRISKSDPIFGTPHVVLDDGEL
jgi:hypothetical protein